MAMLDLYAPENEPGGALFPLWIGVAYDLSGRSIGGSESAVTLDQLRIFVAVAERQHVTHAAKALRLAQSAASHAIKTL
jgi:hypothetical protein